MLESCTLVMGAQSPQLRPTCYEERSLFVFSRLNTYGIYYGISFSIELATRASFPAKERLLYMTSTPQAPRRIILEELSELVQLLRLLVQAVTEIHKAMIPTDFGRQSLLTQMLLELALVSKALISTLTQLVLVTS